MSKRGKKYTNAVQQAGAKTVLPVAVALENVKKLAFVKFNESVDVDINLGIDATKGDQGVRGSVVLPHGRGRQVRVLVFAKGEHAEEAKRAGADYVGAEDLVEKITGGWLEFDQAVATPDLMGLVGKVARILGPRNLLPNKKLGTVAFEVGTVVQELKSGRAFFKNDKSGVVHFTIGKTSFDIQKLNENLNAFIKALMGAKPASAKGKFLKKMTVSSTMGVGLQIDTDEVLRSA